jgi:Fe2+ transport system protein FeoA
VGPEVRTTCPLCGFEYEPGDAAFRASGCPLATGSCQQLHCPRCGYAVPDERASLVARFVRRLFGAPTRELSGVAQRPLRLTDIPTGTRGAVTRLDAAPALSAQLAAQGVVPGTVLRLMQRHPAFVIEVGETVLAFERSVAEVVWLQPGDPGLSGRLDAGA